MGVRLDLICKLNHLPGLTVWKRLSCVLIMRALVDPPRYGAMMICSPSVTWWLLSTMGASRGGHFTRSIKPGHLEKQVILMQ